MQILYRILLLLLVIPALPLAGGITLLIALTSGCPVLFCQQRIGKKGKPFTIYKFRTMVPEAERMKKKLTHLNEAHGPTFKLYNDPRYTRLGKTLAHTGLDELPQLYNVLVGDMALFGPRPLPVSEEKKLKPWQKERERIKPGIISPWILEGYHRTPFDTWMKSDIAYVKNKSVWYDLRLFVRTAFFMGSLIAHEMN